MGHEPVRFRSTNANVLGVLTAPVYGLLRRDDPDVIRP